MQPNSHRLSRALGSLVLLAGALPAAAKGPDAIDIAATALGETRRVEVTLPEHLAGEGLPAVEGHYAALSARLGTPVAVPEAALNEVGYELLGRERFPEAIAVFERAARENPGSANAWDSLAEALAQGGLRGDALEASRRAAGKPPLRAPVRPPRRAAGA